jgi:predicted DNA-binding transcriptional regulator AlpA
MTITHRTEPALMSLAAAARRVGCSVPSLEKLADAGEFPRPVWIGHRRHVFRDQVEQWLSVTRASTGDA